MMTDPISDLLTRIRNALMVRRSDVRLRASRMGEHIVAILKQRGFIHDYSRDEKELLLKLKYDDLGAPVIEGMKRVRRPGLRVYTGKSQIPKVRGGIGISIVSTSHGVMTDSDARKQGVGGEVICAVW